MLRFMFSSMLMLMMILLRRLYAAIIFAAGQRCFSLLLPYAILFSRATPLFSAAADAAFAADIFRYAADAGFTPLFRDAFHSDAAYDSP